MPTPPRQSRSIESTRRMLDAAEELFRIGGGDALTVEAVIERAGTSTGAFYARFGNRRGLFVAMHERALATFDAVLRDASNEALAQPTLRGSLYVFFRGAFDMVRLHRNTMHFHVIQNAHDAEMRAQGNQLSQGVFALLVKIVEAHSPSSAEIDLGTLDLVGRAFFGLILEMMLFASEEVTGLHMSDEQRAEGFTEMVLASL